MLYKRSVLFEAVELEAKYFHIWASKCKFKSKKNQRDELASPVCKAILSVASLERRAKVTGSPAVVVSESVRNDFQTVSRSRPAPRKPEFLNDSVDFSHATHSLPSAARAHTQSHRIEGFVSIEPPVTSPPAVLMPPSAFQFPWPMKIQVNTSTNSSSSSSKLVSASQSQITRTEGAPDGQVRPRPDSSPAPSPNTARLKSGTMSEPDFGLIEVKKRLENFSIKSDKLK